MSGDLTGVISVAFGARARAVALGVSGFTGTWCVEATDGRYFVKTLPAARFDMLAAEADGLAAIAATRTIRVPKVHRCARVGGQAILALEWLDFAPPDRGFGARLGEHLAALHAAAPPMSGWGWPRTNWLGGTAQDNTMEDETTTAGWWRFLFERRLEALARPLDEPALAHAIAELRERQERFFTDGHRPTPSLIHGDLWSGNWAMLANGEPVIFDPAVSVSDAEAELAMAELFGAPPEGFWPAYLRTRPVGAGYARLRRTLYQLVHLMNHALLFGGGYRRQALALANRLVTETR